MGRPLARFTPSRVYISLTLFAVCGAVFSAWNALRWTPSWIAAGLFAISALLMLAVTLRPAVEIHETHLAIGRMQIPWREIRRIDQTGWNTPLAVMLTLAQPTADPAAVSGGSGFIEQPAAASAAILARGAARRHSLSRVLGRARDGLRRHPIKMRRRRLRRVTRCCTPRMKKKWSGCFNA